MGSVGAVSSSSGLKVSHPFWVEYQGGKVLKNPRFVPMYLGSYWATKKGQADRAHLDGFTRSIVKGSYSSLWKEYGVRSASYAGSDLVSRAIRNGTVTDKNVQAVIEAELAKGAIPAETGETVYTVYLPPKVTLVSPDGYTSRDGVGGYHYSFDTADGKRVYYAVMAYPDKTNGIQFTNNALDNITIAASHEMTEVVTDPDVGNGELGWYDYTYGEIGDIQLAMGYPLSDVYGKSDGYMVQKEWSNKDGAFELEAKRR